MSLRERLALPLLRRLDPETAHGLALARAPRRARAAARRRGLAAAPDPPRRARARQSARPRRRVRQERRGRRAARRGRLRLRRGRRRRRRCRSRATRGRGSSASPRTARSSTASASTTTATAAIAARLAARPPGGVVGLNLGANKASADRAADYRRGAGGGRAARRLRHRQRLLAQHRAAARAAGARPRSRGASRRGGGGEPRRCRGRCRSSSRSPPTSATPSSTTLVEVGARGGVAGIVATNTTLARDGLKSRHAARGGRPLRRAALRALDRGSRAGAHPHRRQPAAHRGRRRRLGRGGLRQDPRRRLGGAALHRPRLSGLGLVPRLLRGLDALLARDGFASVAEAVGTARTE